MSCCIWLKHLDKWLMEITAHFYLAIRIRFTELHEVRSKARFQHFKNFIFNCKCTTYTTLITYLC